MNEDVIGVVGPLRANVAMACAEKAEELGLTNLDIQGYGWLESYRNLPRQEDSS